MNKKLWGIALTVIIVVAVAGVILWQNQLLSPSNKEKERTVVDSAGRTVQVPMEVNRVVGTFPWVSWTMYALNASDKLVGVCGNTLNFVQFERLDPEYKNKCSIGPMDNLNVEEIMRLDPDVIICGETDLVQMETLGISTVVADPVGDCLGATTLVGEVIGREEEAEAIVSFYEEIVDLCYSRASNIPYDQRQKVYFMHMEKYTTIGGEAYAIRHLNYSGGINVAENLIGWHAAVELEQLLDWNPDVIILVYGPLKEKALSVEDVLSDPQLQGINAVKNKRVYDAGSYYIYWFHPTVASCLGSLQMAKAFYPELFADVNVTEIANEFTMEFFGKPYLLNAGGVDEIPTD
jgi:iron complex transport system substrate-binding protein